MECPPTRRREWTSCGDHKERTRKSRVSGVSIKAKTTRLNSEIGTSESLVLALDHRIVMVLNVSPTYVLQVPYPKDPLSASMNLPITTTGDNSSLGKPRRFELLGFSRGGSNNYFRILCNIGRFVFTNRGGSGDTQLLLLSRSNVYHAPCLPFRDGGKW